MKYFYEVKFDFNFNKKRKLETVALGNRYVRRKAQKVVEGMHTVFTNQMIKKLMAEKGKKIHDYMAFPNYDEGTLDVSIYFLEKDRCEESRKQFEMEWNGKKKALWPHQLKHIGVTLVVSETKTTDE